MRIAPLLALFWLTPALAAEPNPDALPDSPPAYVVANNTTATVLAVSATAGSWFLVGYGVDRSNRSGGDAGSAAAITLGITAAQLAPAAGHLYAGGTKHALHTSLGRAALAGGFIVSAAAFFPLGAGLCAIGWVGLALYDIVDSSAVAERLWRRNRHRWQLDVAALDASDRKLAPGLRLSGRF